MSVAFWILLSGLVAALQIAAAMPESGETGALQARIDATASGGILTLEAGIHLGPIIIARPLTLRGSSGAVIDGVRDGSVIRIRSDNVRIEGLTIRNSGLDLGNDEAGIHCMGDDFEIVDNRIESCLYGIYLREVTGGRIEGNTIIGAIGHGLDPVFDALTLGSPRADGPEFCAVALLNENRRGNGVHLFSSTGVLIENNRIARTRDGIYFSFADDCVAVGNRVSETRYGLHYMYSNDNRFNGNWFNRNAAGAALMYSSGLTVENNEFSGNRGTRAYGMLLQSVDDSVISHNVFAGNTIGFYAENSQRNTFIGNRIAGNYIGMRIGGSSADNVIEANLFERNLHPAEFAGASDANIWNGEQRGNLWQTNQSPDLDGDGVSEFPHHEADFLGDLRQRFPLAGLLSGSPGLEVLRFAHSRSKLPNLPTIEDLHPLTVPPEP